MATLKKKVAADVADTNEEQSPYMNEDEKEVLDADGEQYIEDATKVSSKKMDSVLELLQDNLILRVKISSLSDIATREIKSLLLLLTASMRHSLLLSLPIFSRTLN